MHGSITIHQLTALQLAGGGGRGSLLTKVYLWLEDIRFYFYHGNGNIFLIWLTDLKSLLGSK
jgi:hypothetical protein